MEVPFSLAKFISIKISEISYKESSEALPGLLLCLLTSCMFLLMATARNCNSSLQHSGSWDIIAWVQLQEDSTHQGSLVLQSHTLESWLCQDQLCTRNRMKSLNLYSSISFIPNSLLNATNKYHCLWIIHANAQYKYENQPASHYETHQTLCCYQKTPFKLTKPWTWDSSQDRTFLSSYDAQGS